MVCFPKVSIIISSYNYDEFLSVAISSALAVDWPNLEVIVVDDGSTDNSPKIIQNYSDRVIAVFQENAGRVSACNTGFGLAKGELILFLDSDDALSPNIITEIFPFWSNKVSKIQFQMAVIDSYGNKTGQLIPSFEVNPTSNLIKHWFSTTSSYPTPVGSGNIYSKAFLDEIFPLDTSVWDSSDSCCLAAAPFFGSIETVIKPLVYYRVHGRNASLATQVDTSFPRNEVLRAQQRFDYAVRFASSKGITINSKSIYNSLSFATNRIISFRLAPDLHPIKSDTIFRILIDSVYASLNPQGIMFKNVVLKLVFIFTVGIMPFWLAKKAVFWRLVPDSRPSRRWNANRFISILRRRI